VATLDGVLAVSLGEIFRCRDLPLAAQGAGTAVAPPGAGTLRAGRSVPTGQLGPPRMVGADGPCGGHGVLGDIDLLTVELSTTTRLAGTRGPVARTGRDDSVTPKVSAPVSVSSMSPAWRPGSTVSAE
jgi:hypothetical protein